MREELADFLSVGSGRPRADAGQVPPSEWNATSQAFPSNARIPDLVAAQALTSPHAVAVTANGEAINYGELELQANRLAHYLLSRGAGPERLVALCLERSVAFAIGALAILKTGAAYVPLDPLWPLDRLTFMLNDCGASVVVTRRSVALGFPQERWQVVDPKLDADAIARCPASARHIAPDAESLAYVIYTSGSTGQPKGVQITQGGLLNLIFWHQRAFRVGPADRASLLASPGFDASVWELWPYLCAGASLHVPDDHLRNDAEGLRDWLIAQGITITFVPTPLAELMIGLTWPAATPLRVMLTGADTLHRYPPASLPFDLVNNYGPTECTVVATSGVVPPAGSTERQPAIGGPIANTQVFILDEHLKPAPVGVTGELHLGGKGLARGYLNRPALTAEKFIPNPFSNEPGSRLYKTGDLARYLSDGQLAFVGRTDDQIKIRGFRIEPGEIVAVLDRHPSIHVSHVMAREDDRGEIGLVAYIVLSEGLRPALEELRAFLLNDLPEYMVPGVFVVLDSLPLTSNGKVDRGALPAPDDSNILRSDPGASPNTVIEERVAAIVSSLLGLQQVGVDDNFFMLGGHSLLGAQLISRIREAFDVELSLRTLFEAPTVAYLSAEIGRLLMAQLAAMSEEEAEQRLSGLSS
jgi:amino acid adenylation domain-containing protein